MEVYRKQVEETVDYLRARMKRPLPRVVLVLGTGLGALADAIQDTQVFPYQTIPHFPKATAPGHSGNLIFGQLGGKNVAALQGRFHYYEGYPTRKLTFPVRVISLLGAKTLVATNAAGGLTPSFSTGMFMLMRDHINFIGENPLRGPNIDAWGPRFPDLSEPYDPSLIRLTLQCASRLQISDITTGIYVAIPGPSLETPAETRYLRNCGADAVGMSTVPEVIVAKHAGMRVLGISVIANVNDPDEQQPIVLEEVIGQVRAVGDELQRLLTEVLKEL